MHKYGYYSTHFMYEDVYVCRVLFREDVKGKYFLGHPFYREDLKNDFSPFHPFFKDFKSNVSFKESYNDAVLFVLSKQKNITSKEKNILKNKKELL